jgi:hypothetical protein
MMMRKPSQSVSMTSCLSRSGVNQFLPGWRRCCSDRAGRRVRTRSTGWAWSRMVTARSLGSRQDACYTEVAGTLLAPTASRPRPSMLSWGEMVYDPNAGLRE